MSLYTNFSSPCLLAGPLNTRSLKGNVKFPLLQYVNASSHDQLFSKHDYKKNISPFARDFLGGEQLNES